MKNDTVQQIIDDMHFDANKLKNFQLEHKDAQYILEKYANRLEGIVKQFEVIWNEVL